MQFSKRDINKTLRNGEQVASYSSSSQTASSQGGLSLDTVRRNFVSIAFFKRLFQAHDSSDSSNILDIEPNDLDSTITDIQLKFGAWSDGYISAFGQNSASSGGGGDGSVTSVDLTMPPEFVVTGNPITSSGTLSVSLASGYSLLSSSTQTISGQKTFSNANTYFRGVQPDGDNTYNLGASTNKWKDLYVNDVYTTYVDFSGGGYLQEESGVLNWHKGSNSYTVIHSGNISQYADTYTHPTDGANTTITAASGKVLSAITVNSLGHVTSVSSKTLVAADIPNLAASKITSGTFDAARIPSMDASKITSGTFAAARIPDLSGTYLPLSGGTLTGTLHLSNASILMDNTAKGYYLKDSAGYSYAFGFDNGENLWIGATATAATHHTGQTFISAGYNGTSGNSTIRICVPNANNNGGTNYYALHSGNYSNYLDSSYVKKSGDTMTGNLNFGANSLGVVCSNGTVSMKYIIGSGGTNRGIWDDTANEWTIYKNSNNHTIMAATSSLSVGIGTTSPSQKLHVNGNIYATGEVTALSDIRYKNVIEDLEVSTKDIANLPVFRFTWNDGREDKGIHIGTSAQAVQELFPELVLGKDELSVNYATLGTTLGILSHRKLSEHEQRIVDLENENKALKERIKVLEEQS